MPIRTNVSKQRVPHKIREKQQGSSSAMFHLNPKKKATLDSSHHEGAIYPKTYGLASIPSCREGPARAMSVPYFRPKLPIALV